LGRINMDVSVLVPMDPAIGWLTFDKLDEGGTVTV